MAVLFACPVDVDQAVPDPVFEGGVIEDAGEDEFIGSPAEFEVAYDLRVLLEEVDNVLDGGGGEGEPVGTADYLVVQREFTGGEQFFLEHFIGEDLQAVFAGDAPIDQVILLNAGGGVFPFVFDGFAGYEFEAFSLGEVLIDMIG